MHDIRHDWTRAELAAVYRKPLLDLLYEAQTIHRRNFAANRVQISTLLSIKTGGCPEDCGYCSQSAYHKSGVKAEKLMDVCAVLAEAKKAKAAGATRFCMGAAWRAPKDRDLDAVCEMVSEVKALGLETCATLGMLSCAQAGKLKDAGLDYYNHNIDTSPEYYGSVVTTRRFDDRIETLDAVRGAGIHVCSGGIVGMGESEDDRIGMIHALATMDEHPESVPVNLLMRVEGTKLGDAPPLDILDFVRTIGLARIAMPKSFVRLSAGREYMSDEAQALCFMAGANSIFYGEKLLTTPNPEAQKDLRLLAKLGITVMEL